MSKLNNKGNSRERIGSSIDQILGNLNIRSREEKVDESKDEVKQLHKKLADYESLGSIKELRREKEQLEKEVQELLKQKEALFQYISSLKDNSSTNLEEMQTLSMRERDRRAFQPSLIIQQYCEQPEGKRKLTIHLREVEYQAIMQASQHLRSSKGQIMDTITRALRFYIPEPYYIEAERDVHQKAIQAVRGVLENMGFSVDEINERLPK